MFDNDFTKVTLNNLNKYFFNLVCNISENLKRDKRLSSSKRKGAVNPKSEVVNSLIKYALLNLQQNPKDLDILIDISPELYLFRDDRCRKDFKNLLKKEIQSLNLDKTSSARGVNRNYARKNITLSESDISRIKVLRSKKVSLDVIAEKFNMSRKTLSKILKTKNI